MSELTAKELNNKIVLLRKVVITARVHLIRKLIAQIKRITKGNDEKKKKRIVKYEKEIQAIKVRFFFKKKL